MLQAELNYLLIHPLSCLHTSKHLYIHLYFTAMDDSNIDTRESAWMTSRNRVENKVDVILRSPKFTSIERFMVHGGGHPFEMYGRMMEIMFPKEFNVTPNIMNEVMMKSIANLKAIRSVDELNGLYGLHDRIGNNTYKGVSELIIWLNGSFDLHDIVELPKTFDELINEGEIRTFNFFESMYPLNIRKDAENGLFSAFRFWNVPKTKFLFDNLLDEFMFEYKDSDNNPERTYDLTNFGTVTMMKAIILLQKSIIDHSKGTSNKDDFVDNTLPLFTAMSKEERDLTLMMELKTILLKVNISSEFIKSLLQEKLNSESFIVEKEQYRRRQNLLLCYRGIQFLLERKFEIFINITLFQKVVFPVIKEMVMDEYLSDISNDTIVCLIRAGTVILRCEIWKHFLAIRDDHGFKSFLSSCLSSSMNNKRKTEKARSTRAKTRTSSLFDKITHNDLLVHDTNPDDVKCSNVSDIDKLGEDIEDVGHKLAIHKPWFSHSLSIDNSISLKSIPMSDSIVSQEPVHTAVQTIPDTFHIYDTYKHSGINQEIQVSTSTDTPRECRLRPRVKVDKISK